MDLDKFVPIQDFPAYSINGHGMVRTEKTGRIKAITYDKKGYARVSLYVHDKCHFKQLHRLLAIAFIPNAEDKPQVNHIDGNPSNYTLKNLEWATASENVQDGFNRGRVAWNKGMRSIDNMTLEDLAKQLPRLQEECKALWGEDWPIIDLGGDQHVPTEDTYRLGALEPYWQAMLKQMVIAEDPIKYLGENI